MKDIIKELVIVLLMLLIVVLLLGVLFYDYIPINKTVPIKIEAYKISNELEEELGKKVLENQAIVKTYTIEGADLELYDDYDKGKKNPFSLIDEGKEESPIVNNTIDDKHPNINTTK